MSDSYTPNLNLTKPAVGASADSWGDKTNVNWDKVDAEFPNYLPLTGGSLSGSLSVTGDVTASGDVAATGNITATGNLSGTALSLTNTLGINYSGIGTHWNAFGWDGSFVTAYVDGTSEGQLASTSWVNGNFATTSWVQGNYYTAGTTDGRYLYKGGDTCSGALAVNGRLTTQDAVMCASGVFYVANNTNYYLARNTSDGAWRFVENGTVNSTLDTSGNLTLRGNFYGNAIQVSYVHSTGNLQVDGGANVASTVAVGATGVIYTNWHASNAFGFASQPGYIYGYMNGSAVGSLVPPSSQELKRDIAPVAVDCLDFVLKLPLRQYRYTGDDTLRPVGYLAEDVHRLLPGSVGLDARRKPLIVDPNVTIAALFGAVQQLTRRVEQLEAQRA
jgi:endosialidase-like protein